jgi:hypothetical protein
MNIMIKSALSVLPVVGLGLVAAYFLNTKIQPGRYNPLKSNANTNSGRHEEDLLDEGIDESFPASDPVSVSPID